MTQSLTLRGVTLPRVLVFFAGAGMAVCSALSVQLFFATNYPPSAVDPAWANLSAFLACDTPARSAIAQFAGVPLGYFGLVMGMLVAFGAVFPSAGFERTNKALSVFNAIVVVALFSYSVLVVGSLCPLSAGYYVFAVSSLALFAAYGIDREQQSLRARWLRPSSTHLLAFAVLLLVGGWGLREYHKVRRQSRPNSVAAFAAGCVSAEALRGERDVADRPGAGVDRLGHPGAS